MKVQGHKMYNTQFFQLKNVHNGISREKKTLIFLSRQYLSKFQVFFYKNCYIFMTISYAIMLCYNCIRGGHNYITSKFTTSQ